MWKVFYRNREEIIEDLRKLHNESFIVFTTHQTTLCEYIEEIFPFKDEAQIDLFKEPIRPVPVAARSKA